MGRKSKDSIEKIILDNIPYLAWYKDIEGRYTMVNEAFIQAYHLPRENIIGKTDFDFCAKEKALEFQRSDEEVKRSGERQFVEQNQEFSRTSLILRI